MVKISVVIPNWNGVDKLKKNLPQVIKSLCKHSFEVIVVDDASSDESVDFIKTNFPLVKLIEKKINSGFSSTVNLGVKSAEGEFIVLLNTDAVPNVGFLDFALPHFENNQVFSVGCNVGGSYAIAEFRDGYFWHNQAKVKPKVAHETLWASGGSGIFRRKIWDELNGLDTLYDPFYEEDVDLGYRANKRGYINIWEPKSVVEHYREEGVIAKNFSKLHVSKVAQRNQLIFIWKNITDLKLIIEHKFAVFKMILGHPKYFFIVLSALKKLPVILRKRNEEQKVDILSDREILEKFSS